MTEELSEEKRLAEFGALLKKSRQYILPEAEKNIFSIGGKGHYENPVSDLLAFFLNPHEVHGFGDLVVRSINEAAGFSPYDVDFIQSPQREVGTADGKRMDIVFEGSDYITVIENKIRHWAANPVKSYNDCLDKDYPSKRKNRLLLSVYKESLSDEWKDWKSITYEELLVCIRKNLGSVVLANPYSKWLVLFREFLLNIEQEYKVNSMSAEQLKFVQENYNNIFKLHEMTLFYIEELIKKGLDAIRKDGDKETDVSSWKNNWGIYCPALRLHHNQWEGETNITLYIDSSGSFQITAYIYNIADADLPKLEKAMITDKLTWWGTEAKTIRCFRGQVTFDLDKVFAEIKEAATNLHSYYDGK